MIKRAFILLLACALFPLCLISCECEHEWDDGVVTVKPTEEREGVKTFTCTKCEETKKESIPKNVHTNHVYSSKWGGDATDHWLICDVPGCNAVTGKHVHTWTEKHGGGEICVVCRRER